MTSRWFRIPNIIASGLLTALLFFVASSPAHADCTGPAATAGTIINNSGDKVMLYCDGTNWIAMHVPGSGSGGCTSPAAPEGAVIYSEDNRVIQGCAGNVWRAMGPVKPVPSGLIGHWKLDEIAESWQPTGGQVDGALLFFGDDDYVEISNFNPPHQGTVTFWIKPGAIGSAQRILGGDDAYETRLLANGILRNEFFAGGTDITESTTWLSAGTWYHVALTYNETGGEHKIYINGGTPEATSTKADDDPGGPFELRLGHRTGASGEYFDGLLDDVRIYDQVLDDTQVGQVMNNQDPGVTPISHWALDESSGTNAPDTGSGGNDGTLMNFSQLVLDSVATNHGIPQAGAIETSGVHGGGLESVGSDLVQVVDDGTFNQIPMTAMMWVNPGDLDWGKALFKRGSLNLTTSGCNFGWALGTDGSGLDGDLYFKACHSGSHLKVLSSDNVIQAGVWQHVAVSWDGSPTVAGGSNVAEWKPSGGQVGGALEFDGGDDYVAVANFDPPHQGTVTFWIKPDAIGSLQRILGGDDAYEIRLMPDGTLGNEFFAGSTDVTYSSTSLSAGTWYHVAMAYNETGGEHKIYINGGTPEATSTKADDDPGGPFELRLGHRTGASGEHFDGMLDDVRIYDQVMNDTQVGQVMNNQDPGISPIAHWKLDESNGLTAADEATSYDGTLTNINSAQNAHIYVNGREVTYDTLTDATGSYLPDTAAPYSLDFAGTRFNAGGVIDDVRFYDRVLSAEEIAVFASYCANPAGTDGELIYNSSSSVMQYCNGERWVGIGK